MKIFPENFIIAAISPAGKATPERVDAGIKILQKLGAKVKLMPNVLKGNPEWSYLSATDDERRADLEAAWLDPEVDMIWAVRGGYGCVRLLPMLNWEKLVQRKDMPVAGFSDITTLHWAMSAKGCGIPMALPMFSFLEEIDEYSLQSLAGVFQNKNCDFTLPALREGELCGIPLPGNLTVAASLCGTPYFPDTTGKILILEEVREYPYRIDRTLNQLLLNNAFERCAGVVFGKFSSSGNPDEIMTVLKDFTSKVKVPVYYGMEYGHELPFVSLRSDKIITVHQ